MSHILLPLSLSRWREGACRIGVKGGATVMVCEHVLWSTVPPPRRCHVAFHFVL